MGEEFYRTSLNGMHTHTYIIDGHRHINMHTEYTHKCIYIHLNKDSCDLSQTFCDKLEMPWS